MDNEPLGPSPLAVPQLGLSTWSLGGEANGWDSVDDNEAIAAMQGAIAAGMTLIDTAPSYGNGHAEVIVGRAVAGRRDQVMLATKCGVPPGVAGGAAGSLAPQSLISACERSLRRMNADFVDFYQCHCPDPETPIRDTMEALGKLQKQGKIRAIGLCHFGCDQIAAAREFGVVRVVQTPLSLLNQGGLDDLVPFCRDHEIGVLAREPLARGLLSGRFGPTSPIRGRRAKHPDFIGPRFSRNLALLDALRPIAEGYGKMVSQLAIRWVLQHDGVSCVLFGATRPSQVDENAGALGWTISPEDMKRIDALLRQR